MQQNNTTLEVVTTETSVPICAVVIWLHGLGADGYDFIDMVPELRLPEDCGVRFVFPHALMRPVTVNNGIVMRAWYDIYSLTAQDREDWAGMQESSQAIAALIDEQIEAGVDSRRIILAGFSQGGAMALVTGLCYPLPLAGILSLSAYLPAVNELSSLIHPMNKKTSIMLAHGTMDPIIPISAAQLARQWLLQMNYTVEWQQYPMAHSLCHEEISDIREWMLRVI